MNFQSQPIREHLLELRRRVTWAAASVVVTTVVAFVFHQQILQFLMGPAQGFADIPNGKPIYTDLTEFLGVAAKASLVVGIFTSLPFVLYQIVMFIAPGLNPTERRYLYALLPVSLLVFIIGAAFGYWILFPPMVKFLLTFGNEIATPLIRISTYINLMLTLLFWMGVIFETPVVIFFLAKIGVVTSEFLARQRRWALVAAFVLGAVITPTIDPINQTIVAVPIIVLYEVGIWLAKLAQRGRRAPTMNLDSE
ncbi:MAG: twin-arginine translocase subunit TatC [Chloroflexi bacterium]|nr:twin-arginine translocase subunit TatC [Chloroflexota bacterium]MCH8309165.1 twin-arginine translocase subunit TatC [Chloroflexota bacterium]